MNKSIGYSNLIPQIKSFRFPKGKIVVELTDGRTITMPDTRFPEIAKLTPTQKRKHKTLAGMGLMFDDIDTVYHISDFLGSSVVAITFTKNKLPDTLQKKAEAGKAAESLVKYEKK